MCDRFRFIDGHSTVTPKCSPAFPQVMLPHEWAGPPQAEPRTPLHSSPPSRSKWPSLESPRPFSSGSKWLCSISLAGLCFSLTLLDLDGAQTQSLSPMLSLGSSHGPTFWIKPGSVGPGHRSKPLPAPPGLEPSSQSPARPRPTPQAVQQLEEGPGTGSPVSEPG